MGRLLRDADWLSHRSGMRFGLVHFFTIMNTAYTYSDAQSYLIPILSLPTFFIFPLNVFPFQLRDYLEKMF